MKEIVWVYGASAAGKGVFISKVTGSDPSSLQAKFDWQNKEVSACQEAIDWIGKYIGDPIVKNRALLISRILELIKNTDVLLIKGQDVDLVNDIPNKLLTKLPECKHRVIFINVSIKELMVRLPQKPWWNGTDTEYDTQRYVKYQLEKLKQINKNFDIICIDGSAKGNYASLPLPEVLQNR